MEKINLSLELEIIGNNAFENCEKLVSIGNAYYNITQIGNAAFRNCLIYCNVSKMEQLKYIAGSAFSGCKNLTSDAALPIGIKTLGSYVFNNCNKISLSDFTQLEEIQDYCFSNAGYNINSIITLDYNTIYNTSENKRNTVFSNYGNKSFVIGRDIKINNYPNNDIQEQKQYLENLGFKVVLPETYSILY